MKENYTNTHEPRLNFNQTNEFLAANNYCCLYISAVRL